MNTAIANALKAITLLALMCVYFYFAGRTGWNTLFGRKLAVAFCAGAVIALWVGGQRIGTLDPVSFRPIFLVVGAFIMVAVFVVMLTTREVVRQLQGRANIPASFEAVWRPGFEIVRY